jgi:hypothetical protein
MIIKLLKKHGMENILLSQQLPILSKVFEKILLKIILNIIAKSKILSDSQFGFRTKHSTIRRYIKFTA